MHQEGVEVSASVNQITKELSFVYYLQSVLALTCLDAEGLRRDYIFFKTNVRLCVRSKLRITRDTSVHAFK